jgi:predicted small secreted protein
MRHIAIITLAAMGLTLGACSRDTAEDIEQNVEQAGTEIKEGAQAIVSDPDVKEAGSALKEAAKDGGEAIKDVAGEMRDAARDDKATNN